MHADSTTLMAGKVQEIVSAHLFDAIVRMK